MKVHRAGTNRKIKARLQLHRELMEKYIKAGMAVDAASTRAFEELCGRAPGVAVREVKP